MKYIKIKDLPEKLCNDIIKAIPTAKTIGYEVKMADKITNKQLLEEIRNIKYELHNHINEFKEFKNDMLSLPTIQKELASKLK